MSLPTSGSSSTTSALISILDADIFSCARVEVQFADFARRRQHSDLIAEFALSPRLQPYLDHVAGEILRGNRKQAVDRQYLAALKCAPRKLVIAPVTLPRACFARKSRCENNGQSQGERSLHPEAFR